MTMMPDGSCRCDRCGASCGNGGVAQTLVVCDLSSNPGAVVNLHFCRGTREWTGEGENAAWVSTPGCDGIVLNDEVLADFLSRESAYERQERIIE